MSDEPFIPTRYNSTVDGETWGEIHEWDNMSFNHANWRTGSLFGHDPHWRVPHVNGETFHRVRRLERDLVNEDRPTMQMTDAECARRLMNRLAREAARYFDDNNVDSARRLMVISAKNYLESVAAETE